jgi:ADP-sugar diphosphatase
MKEQLEQAPKFQRWHQLLEKNGLHIQRVKEIYTKYRSNGDVLFALLELDADTPEGDKIPPVCFLKGLIISVLVCLIDEQSGEKYLLMVKQRRICDGGHTYELVAGMVDSDDDPHEVALREVEEETGLQLQAGQVILLNQEPFFTTTGTSDEALYFYYCELSMSKEEIEAHHGKNMGEAHEHERITTIVVPFAEAKAYLNNTSGLLNLYMYEEVLRNRSEDA